MDPAVRSFFAHATPGSHVGIIAHDDAFLATAVAAWVAEPLSLDGGVILVGTSPHLEGVRAECARLHIPLAAAERAGRAVLIDADWMLSKFMLDGTPDAQRFRALLDEILARLAGLAGSPTRVRAWGEMVSLLRARNEPQAVAALEALWERAIKENGFALLCTYHTAGAAEGASAALFRDVARTHGSWMAQPAPSVPFAP